MRLCGMVAAAAALMAGCAAPPQDTGPKPVELSVGTFNQKWREPIPLSDDAVTELYLRDDFVFAYTQKHMAFMLDKDSGKLRTAIQPVTGESRLFPPVVLKQYEVYPSVMKVFIYDRLGRPMTDAKGRVVGEFAPDGGVVVGTGGVGYGTRVYVGGDAQLGRGKAFCVDVAGSPYRPVWEPAPLMTNGGLVAAPAYFQGCVYYGDQKGDVYAVNADNFAPIWPMTAKDTGLTEDKVFKAYGAIDADLRADEFGVYVATVEGQLYCLNRTTGRVKWIYYCDMPLRHAPEVTASGVFIYVDGKGLVALDKTNSSATQYSRTPRWIMKEGRGLLGIDDQYAYIQRDDGAIVAVDKNDGPAGPQHVSKNRYSVFASNNKGNVIYAATADGHVYAITMTTRAGIIGELALAPALPMPVALGK
jgi:outer membrane protein assembly factor BamB